jgi:hypothetical protein
MDTFLQSRIATGHESNRDFYDEDVNVYLALLLNSLVNDRFHREASSYVAHRESDLHEIVGRAENPFVKHEIYRRNGDFLLMRTGLFHVPRENDAADPGMSAAVERGRAYYRFAYSFADRIPPRYRPVSDVLAKLSHDFDKYRLILSHMRGAFLNLVEPLTAEDVSRLRGDMDARERTERIRALQDTLLDAYLEYQGERSETNRARMRGKLEELRKLEPSAWPRLTLATAPAAGPE